MSWYCQKKAPPVEVQARTLDDVVAVGPLGQALNTFRDDEHVVVHDPKPLSAQGRRRTWCRQEKPPAAASVFKLRRVDNAVGATLYIG